MAIGLEHSKSLAQIVVGLQSGTVPEEAVEALGKALEVHKQRQSRHLPTTDS